MKTLVIYSHPYYQNSRVTNAFAQAATELENVTVRNLDELYGTDFSKIDVTTEQKLAEEADRIVFLFPIHWFNLSPMLKAYLNVVWAYGWSFGENGYALADKELQIIAGAGAADLTYQRAGLVAYTTDEILAPLEASAYYCSMKYNKPLVFTSSNAVDDNGLKDWVAQVQTRLQSPLGANVKGISQRKKPA